MNGLLVYRIDGVERRIPVRDCPNPAIARACVEELLEEPVRWLATQ
jgi:hypothetical protein